MNKLFKKYKLKYAVSVLLLCSTVLFLIWWQFISLKPYNISTAEITKLYQQHANYMPNISFTLIDKGQYKIAFTSYDGDIVEGRLEFPDGKSMVQWVGETVTDDTAIFLGVSAMGRNYLRWWQDSYKGRPTVTQVNKIGDMALASNNILVAIDARYHGTRKTETLPLSKIMNNLRFWGNRSYYENMVFNTVMDYKHLINALEATFGRTVITVAGYSMGAQVSLLLGATDKRIDKVISIAPPNVGNTVAKVAPINFVSMFNGQKVWLLTANGDDYADDSENLDLFDQINSKNKRHLTFESGHILPEGYTEQLRLWFEN